MPSAATPAIRTPSRSGFTLVEISIVLVIIGLIVGGILVGRDLIEAARLRSIANAHQEFLTRWNAFKIKYNCLPGDCPYATRFFGQSTCVSTAGFTNTESCNGDGDGWIFWSGGGIARESNLVWNHLFRAGLAPYEAHDGNVGGASVYNTPYVTAPNKNGVVVWLLGNSTAGNSAAQMYASAADDNVGSNLRGIGLQTARVNSVGGQPRVAIETPQTVSDLDRKMDDGIPGAGKFRASGGYEYDTSDLLTCITGSGVNSAYDFTQTEPTCRYVYSVQQ